MPKKHRKHVRNDDTTVSQQDRGTPGQSASWRDEAGHSVRDEAIQGGQGGQSRSPRSQPRGFTLDD
jgi:hypothetical protein